MSRRYALLLITLFTTACMPKAALNTGAVGAEPGTDPITILDHYSGPAFAELLGVSVWGERVVFCSGVQGLNIYDAADPTDLRLLDRLSFGSGNQLFPRCQHVVVDEAAELLYVSNHGDQLQPEPFIAVVDARKANNLREVAMHQYPESIEGLALWGDYLLAAAHGDGLLIFERGEQGALNKVGATKLENAWAVAVEGARAYIANGSSGIAVIGLEDPSAPELLSSLKLPGAAKDLVLRDGRLYVALGAAGVAMLDIEDPNNPKLIEGYNTPGSAVALTLGSEALFVSDWNDLRAFDLSDREHLKHMAHESIRTQRGKDSRSLGIAASGDLVFSANWTGLVAYKYDSKLSQPDLEISPSPLVFGKLPADESTEATLFLKNTGSAPLEFDKFGGSEGISFSQTPESLAPGESAYVNLFFKPKNTKPYKGRVLVSSNDPDTPQLSLAVTANSIGRGVGDPAPNPKLVDLEGSPINLPDLQGKVVLLAYFATF